MESAGGGGNTIDNESLGASDVVRECVVLVGTLEIWLNIEKWEPAPKSTGNRTIFSIRACFADYEMSHSPVVATVGCHFP